MYQRRHPDGDAKGTGTGPRGRKRRARSWGDRAEPSGAAPAPAPAPAPDRETPRTGRRAGRAASTGTAAGSRPAGYARAWRSLLDEAIRKNRDGKTFDLSPGVLVHRTGGRSVYRFDPIETGDLDTDDRLELSVGGPPIPAEIVSDGSAGLAVAVEADLGESIRGARLKFSDTRLDEALIRTLDAVASGDLPINTALAEAVVAGSRAVRPAPVPARAVGRPGGLDAGQQEAAGRALRQAVTYLWGPPGTGKTQTLAAILGDLADANKRVLVVSNTKQAVDQLLHRVWRSSQAERDPEAAGRIVRLGSFSQAMEGTPFAAAVALDRVVERSTRELRHRIETMEDELETLEDALQECRRRVGRIEARLALDRKIKDLAAAVAEAAEAASLAEGEARQARKQRDRFERALESVRRSGPIGRLVRRSEDAVVEDLAWAMHAADKAERIGIRRGDGLIRAREALRAARSELEGLSDVPSGRSAREKALAEVERRRSEADRKRRELVELRKASDAAGDDCIASARIVGATVAKAYLQARRLGAFDAVIADEASMIVLPALYLVAGLARERVIVCGDHAQLPPILQTRDETILAEIGGDVFRAAGVADPDVPHPNLALLATQYRMADEICRLVSGPMYGGLLTTAPERPDAPRHGRPPDVLGAERLIVVDTSALGPRQSSDAGNSRYNLVHASVARALVRRLGDAGEIGSGDDVGICTPFVAQARLIKSMLEEEGLKERVWAGTVHKYQGADRRIMILDVPDSEGAARGLSAIASAAPPDDDGARQLNVAVSRARDGLVVIANLAHLEARMPQASLLRTILAQMRGGGRVVDARTLLSEGAGDGVAGPRIDDGRPGGTEPAGRRVLASAAFREACNADIDAARRSIVVFSAFVSPVRVAELADRFRRKIAEGVTVRCVTRAPEFNGSIGAKRAAEALDTLESLGCIVDTREAIHEKIVVIDERVVWIGSLNLLSYTDSTDEIMSGDDSPIIAQQVAELVARRPGKRGAADITVAENARCPRCGARRYLASGSGALKCEAGCGGRSAGRTADDGAALPETGDPCPTCGSPTRLRRGRWGAFYSCSRFPACKGKISLN